MFELLNWSSVAFAFLAALFWFWSGLVKLPKDITVGYGGVGGSVQELGDELRRQSKRSARAAICAGIAAICQGFVLLLAP